MTIDGVLFDVDDTLVDTRAAFAHTLAAITRRYLPEVTPEFAPERDRAVLAHWRADAGGHYRAYTQGTSTYLATRQARANDLHATFGGPVLDDAAFAEWNALFSSGFADAWAAHPDAAGTVDALLAAGVAVGALSNAAVELQSSKLARTGLGDRVPMLVGVDTLGVGKPDARVFIEACRRLGTEPARTAYVGDELDIDAVAASAAGLVGVWLDRPGPRRVPVTAAEVERARVLVVRSLAELPDALRIDRPVGRPVSRGRRRPGTIG